MNNFRSFFLYSTLLSIALITLVACNTQSSPDPNDPVPIQAPDAIPTTDLSQNDLLQPTSPPTPTLIPSFQNQQTESLDPTPTSPPQPLPEQEPTTLPLDPAPTDVPTDQATGQPTDSEQTPSVSEQQSEPPTPAPIGVTLTSPTPNSQVVAGTAFLVVGTATSTQPGHTINVALQQPNASIIEDVDLIAQDGDWRALLPVPENIVGPMDVIVTLQDSAGAALSVQTSNVNIVVDRGSAETFIEIFEVSNTAVTGKAIHINGTARSDREQFEVNLGIYTNNCTETAGLVTIPMYGSGYWQGEVIVPNIQGDACIYAFTDDLGQPGQRLAQRPLTILSVSDPNAPAVHITSPIAGQRVKAPFSISGIATNTPTEGFIIVTVFFQDNIEWQAAAFPDANGFWTVYAASFLPGNYPLKAVATLGQYGEVVPQHEREFNVAVNP